MNIINVLLLKIYKTLLPYWVLGKIYKKIALINIAKIYNMCTLVIREMFLIYDTLLGGGGRVSNIEWVGNGVRQTALHKSELQCNVLHLT